MIDELVDHGVADSRSTVIRRGVHHLADFVHRAQVGEVIAASYRAVISALTIALSGVGLALHRDTQVARRSARYSRRHDGLHQSRIRQTRASDDGPRDGLVVVGSSTTMVETAPCGPGRALIPRH